MYRDKQKKVVQLGDKNRQETSIPESSHDPQYKNRDAKIRWLNPGFGSSRGVKSSAVPAVRAGRQRPLGKSETDHIPLGGRHSF